MSRRNIGISSLSSKSALTNSYSTLSTTLNANSLESLSTSLSSFQSQLSAFSIQHHDKIKSSPQFRDHFNTLCLQLGVDPLAGKGKGIWDKLGMGEYYHALGVMLVDVCLRTRERSGGMIGLKESMNSIEILKNPKRTEQSKATVTENDIKRAISALESLDCGYSIVTIGGNKLIRCSPGQLNSDSTILLSAASTSKKGCVTPDGFLEFTKQEGGKGWNFSRIERCLEIALMEDGLIWVDDQSDELGGKEYFVPALFDFA